MSGPPSNSPPPAVFLSYAREDATAVRRLAEALRATGIEVWFDQNELRGGDAWDRAIRKQIRECALFVPVISANTQSRLEGYFRLEWKLAEDRSHLMARGKPFLVPATIDATSERDAHVPEAFLAVQWTQLGGAAADAAFAGRVQSLLAPASGTKSVAPWRAAPSGGHAAPARAGEPRIPDYELLRVIGRGSYGDVWLARGVTGIYRAIKVVWRERFADAAPFEREFKGLTEFAAVSLGESIQLALLHVGRNDEAGFFYYVMELADDADRGREIDPARYTPLTLTVVRARRGRVPAAECVAFGVELARALAGLHRRGLVHRDIKPSNVILVGGGPKLADIGLVTTTSEASSFVGTEGFVPPEGPGAPAADIFALGKLLYELSTGLDRQQFPKLPPDADRLPDARLLAELNEILLRACEPAAEKRYGTAEAILADLLALQAGGSLRRRRSGKQWLRLVAAAAAAGLLATGGAMGWKWLRPPAAASLATQRPEAAAMGETSVAVLPFANQSGDKEQEYFSDGISEEVLNALARVRDLRVPGRNSSFSFKGRTVPTAEIARLLNVTRLVEGSVQRAGNRVRIRVSLTRAADGFSEALGTFDRELTDIFALQDEVARAVVEKLTQRASAGTVAVLTKNPQAYDAYLRGRALQVRAAGDAPAAATLFEEAVALDPAFALAWARLSQARFRGYGGMNDRSPAVVDSAREAVDRALAAQPDLSAALIARAHWLRAAASDYPAAQRDLARAEALQPATAELRFAQSALARDMDDWPEAIRRAREALRLDPQNGDAINALAITLFVPHGDYAEADRLYAQAMAIQGPASLLPFRNRVILRSAWRGPAAALRLVDRAPAGQAGVKGMRARLLLELGRSEEARELAVKLPASTGSVASMQGRNDAETDLLAAVGLTAQAATKAEEIRADSLREFARGNHGPLVRLVYVKAEIDLGHREAALAGLEEWREETRRLPSAYRRIFEFNLLAADFYARLGQPEKTIALLREIRAGGFQPVFTFRPDLSFRPEAGFADLNNDPRFQELEQQAAAWAAAQPDPTDEPAPTGKSPAPAPPPDDKSIAVLPFENMSEDKAANAFFADGIHEEILTALTHIRELRVVSRTSVQEFRGQPGNLREIARKLNVAYILEGSVRRAAGKVVVTGQLIRAATDEHVWAEKYHKDLTVADVFAIQSDLAEKIVASLRTAISPQEKAQLALQPTQSLAAYDAYLQAIAASRDKFLAADGLRATQAGLEQAVALDANFTRAWRALANVSLLRWFLGHERTPEQLAKARTAIDQVSRLAPGSADEASALGDYYYNVHKDYALALAHYRRAIRLEPNVGDHHRGVGMVLRRQNDWAGSTAELHRAIQLDPAEPGGRRSLMQNLWYTRRYAETVPLLRQLLEKIPGNLPDLYALAEASFNARGSTREVAEFFAGLPEAQRESPAVRRLRHDWAIRSGDFAEALRLDRQLGPTPGAHGENPDFALTNALALAALGDLGGARARLGRAAENYRTHIEGNSAPGMAWSRLAKIEALLGHADEVARCGRLAAEALPEASDALWGTEISLNLASAAAWLGDKDRALAELARLFRTTAPMNVFSVKSGADFFPLRGDPRFEALVADPANRAPVF